MSGHTPGPWEYDGGIIQARCFSVAGDANGPSDGGWIAPVAFCAPLSFRDDDLEEWSAPGSVRANARLIAAAPDLLEALEMIAKPIFAHANGDEGPYVTDDEFDEWHERFLITARAAIAKAKGDDHA